MGVLMYHYLVHLILECKLCARDLKVIINKHYVGIQAMLLPLPSASIGNAHMWQEVQMILNAIISYLAV